MGCAIINISFQQYTIGASSEVGEKSIHIYITTFSRNWNRICFIVCDLALLVPGLTLVDFLLSCFKKPIVNLQAAYSPIILSQDTFRSSSYAQVMSAELNINQSMLI